MYCWKCGTQNDDNNYSCVNCREILQSGQQQQAPVEPSKDYSMGGLVPYKNQSALISYYLGVFSLIPCLGAPLGIAAFILGLKGLRYAKEHPESKGTAHAWVGIIGGGLFGLLYLVLGIAMVVGIISAAKYD